MIQRRQSRRLASIVAIVAIACLAIAGCSSSKGGGGGKVTLTWWDYFGYSPQSDGAMTDLIKKYEASHPDVTIKRTAVAYPDFFTKFNQAVATRKVPDIVSIDGGTIPSYAAEGAFADLSKYTSNWPTMKQFYPTVASSVQVDGKTYGVPFRSNALILWYNQDQFSKAGITAPPTTWDELAADAKKLTSGTQSGFCFTGNKTEATTFVYLSLLWQAGGDLDSLGDAASVNALNYLSSFVKDGTAPKSVVQWGWDDLAGQFSAGSCAMMVAGPWVLGDLAKTKVKWTVATVPSGPAGNDATPLGGEAWTVGANSKHVPQAWQLIDWLSQPANSAKDILQGTQSVPNRTDQAENPDANWSPIVPTVAKAVQVARTRVQYGSKYNDISTVVQGMVQSALTGQSSPQQAVDAARSQIAPLLPKS